ncbi:MAG: Clp protease N-terminal domain-containing protein [Hyphomicrobiaceae bacterium]
MGSVFAEEALLASCHRAEELARTAGSSTIDISHLLLALMQTTAAREAFANHHIDIHNLMQVAAHQMEAAAPGATNSPPEASTGFLQALRRAEHSAAVSGRNTVTIRDVVETLLGHGRELDGGAFLQFAQHVRRRRATASDRRSVNNHHRDGGAERDRKRYDGRMQPPQSRQRHAPDASHIAKQTRTERHSVAEYESDPFQLRVERAPNDVGTTARATKHTAQQASDRDRERHTSSTADAKITSTLPELIRHFDERMRDVQQRLGAVAAKLDHLSSSQSAATQRSERTHGDGAPSGRPNSHRETSSSRGPSDRDWQRILRLLERLDGEVQARDSHNSSRRSGGRSARRFQHRSKHRIRSARQERRRYLKSRREQADRDFADKPWSQEDNQRQNVDQSLSLKSNAFEATQRDWEGSDETDDGKRFYLEMTDEIVRAPSIGPRTAEHLTPHGIELVRDLLAADAANLAERISVRHISTQRLEDWQMQARLVCTVPHLRGTHAQLLVGAGYTTPGDICAVSGDVLSADILKFASTRDGQRILRSGSPPEMEKILKWAEHAAEAELERAA